MDYVLDLGCGEGRSTVFLSKLSKNIVGIDISRQAISIAKKSYDLNFMSTKLKDDKYPGGEYKSIFSFFTLFHFQSENDFYSEFSRANRSLCRGGALILVGGTMNLFTKNYSTTVCISDPPVNDGDTATVLLKQIDCKILDYYWSESYIKAQAEKFGFICSGIHYPLATKDDDINFIDEKLYPPYFIMILKKT